MIGFQDSKYIQKINVSIACWSLFCGVVVSLLVVKIRRRVMYLMCTISLLLCYISWTISMERAQTAKNAGTPNNAANIATLFFIYAYSPCYNMGYNALTYSKPPLLTLRACANHTSLHGRGLALCRALQRHCRLPALRPPRRLLHHLCQPHRSQGGRLEVPHLVLLLARLRGLLCVLYVPGDLWPHPGGARLQYVPPPRLSETRC